MHVSLVILCIAVSSCQYAVPKALGREIIDTGKIHDSGQSIGLNHDRPCAESGMVVLIHRNSSKISIINSPSGLSSLSYRITSFGVESSAFAFKAALTQNEA